MPGSPIRDPWLVSLLVARTLMAAIFLTYAACLPVLLGEWGMSAAAAGSVASGFQFGYAVSLLVFSFLADRLGARRVFLLSATLSAAAALTFALFARSYVSGLVLFTTVALAQGGTYTSAIMLLSDRYPPGRRGAAIGYLIASTSLGYAISLLVSGAMLSWGGYELAFLVTAAGPVAGATVAWFALRSTPNRVHPRPAGGAGFLRAVLRNRAAARLTVGYTFHNWELWGLWAWAPAFLAACFARSGSTAAAEYGAYLSASFHVVGLLACSSMGQLSDRLGRRAVLLAMAAASMACSFVFGWLVAAPIAIVVAVGAVYFFTAIGDSAVLSTALTEVVEPAYLGANLALRAAVGFASAGVAPLVFGAVLDATNRPGAPPAVWGWAFAVLGLGGLAATFCAYGVKQRKAS